MRGRVRKREMGEEIEREREREREEVNNINNRLRALDTNGA